MARESIWELGHEGKGNFLVSRLVYYLVKAIELLNPLRQLKMSPRAKTFSSTSLDALKDPSSDCLAPSIVVPVSQKLRLKRDATLENMVFNVMQVVT